MKSGEKRNGTTTTVTALFLYVHIYIYIYVLASLLRAFVVIIIIIIIMFFFKLSLPPRLITTFGAKRKSNPVVRVNRRASKQKFTPLKTIPDDEFISIHRVIMSVRVSPRRNSAFVVVSRDLTGFDEMKEKREKTRHWRTVVERRKTISTKYINIGRSSDEMNIRFDGILRCAATRGSTDI